ncbi:MAG: hypothetical protein ABI725_06355 [Chloroflexota bacterium]
MAFDLEAAAAGDFTHYRLKAGVRHLDRLAAASTDDVVVVFARRAGNVGVFARGQVDALQGAPRREQVERPEYSRAANSDAAITGVSE